jgi:hypothetical protein
MGRIMTIETVEQLKTILTESNVRVEFTKLDGTHRSMLCTKNSTVIPAAAMPTGNNKKPNNTVISVYDLEKAAWRSIKVDNILSWAVA